MYVVTLSVFHNLAIWLLYVNKPEPEAQQSCIGMFSAVVMTRTLSQRSQPKQVALLSCRRGLALPVRPVSFNSAVERSLIAERY